MSDEQRTVPFGFREVAEDEKSRLVGRIFTNVARRYDVMNDLMSLGVHRIWKQALIDWLAPSPDTQLLDVAGGTGDIAFRFLDRLSPKEGDRPAPPFATSIRKCSRSAADARARTRLPRPRRLCRRRRRTLAVSRRKLRRLHDRLRHPQRHAYRARADRSLSRAETRRPLPVSGIFQSRQPDRWSASTISGPSTPFRPSAKPSPTTAPPTNTSSKASAAFRRKRRSRR